MNQIINRRSKMKILKKVKCNKCQSIIEGENSSCSCGKVMIVENIIPNSVNREDYQDLTPKLLNE